MPPRTARPAHPISPRLAARRWLERIVLILAAMLLVRAVGVEPYGVPTGSMSPTLVGNHRATTCPRCGYPVLIGHRDGRDPCSLTGREFCPNCGTTDLDLDHAAFCSGDHLLVNKTVFDWRRPRRWEMAVFRCPAEPGRAYVKRVVGLPGESVQVRDGDLYIDHELTRKTLAECRALRLLVHDHLYPPKPDGWRRHWEKEPAFAAAGLRDGALALDTAGTGNAAWLVYRHWDLDANKVRPVGDEYSYNSAQAAHAAEPVHDFLAEGDVEVRGGDGWIAVGLDDGGEQVVAELPVTTPGDGVRLRDGATERVYRTAPGFALTAGRTYHVEIAFVDRRVSLAIDGVQPLAAVDRPAAEGRDAVTRPVRLGARGVDVRVRNFRLWRDVHYTDAGRHGVRTPVPLRAGEYFVLGDNSAHSDDNRFWTRPDGGPMPVPEANFLGKPIMVHLPGRVVRRDGRDGPWELQGLHWGRVRWLR